MKKQAFSSEKYLNLQRDHIIERINQFDGKLYLEFGGKMLEDFHAARVLPGYEPDNKIKLLQELRDQVEIVIAINANNIEHSKARGDLGISYDQEVLRLIDKFNELGFFRLCRHHPICWTSCSRCLSQTTGQERDRLLSPLSDQGLSD